MCVPWLLSSNYTQYYGLWDPCFQRKMDVPEEGEWRREQHVTDLSANSTTLSLSLFIGINTLYYPIPYPYMARPV